MKKRYTSGILWFLAGWFVGAFAAFAAGADVPLGPLFGLVAALFVAIDPMGIIWAPSDRTVTVPTTEAVPEAA